ERAVERAIRVKARDSEAGVIRGAVVDVAGGEDLAVRLHGDVPDFAVTPRAGVEQYLAASAEGRIERAVRIESGKDPIKLGPVVAGAGDDDLPVGRNSDRFGIIALAGNVRQ